MVSVGFYRASEQHTRGGDIGRAILMLSIYLLLNLRNNNLNFKSKYYRNS
jgi:hypothetical protein